jgi:DNA-binding CsgD family transcriptional regulator
VIFIAANGIFYYFLKHKEEKIMRNDLSPRQQELFNMLLRGIPPREIALNLNIAYNTLLYHQKKLYCKLNVHNIQELMAKYSQEVKYVSDSAATEESETITIRKSVLFGTFGVLIGLLVVIIVFLSFLAFHI